MSSNVIKKELCSGCQACKQKCPYNAIEMIEAEDGFLYPIKNDKCIECGLCEKICPMINEIKNKEDYKQEAYSCRHKDEQVLEKSSSGGAFTAIAQAFCNENYVIFGAKYNEKKEVEHDYIEDIRDIDKFRKSKYVQSNIKHSYSKVKEFLEEEKNVLFSGTPCQIAALKKYLGKEYENLLCVDLICHGIPSPKVFKKYLNFLENKYKSNIKDIQFRKKTNTNKIWNSKNIFLIFENEKRVIINNEQDLYLRCFDNQIIFRESCGTCKFASPTRYSDITIGDSWGIEKMYSEIDVHKGESVIIINTNKGKKIKDIITNYMDIRDLTVNFVIKENKQFREPTEVNPQRKKFFNELDSLRFDKLVNKYMKISIKKRIRKAISKVIPKKIKNIIYKFKER